MRGPDNSERRFQRTKDAAYLTTTLAAIPALYFLTRSSKTDIKVTDPHAVTRAKIHRNGEFVQWLTRTGPFETVLHDGETMTGTVGGENLHVEDYPQGKAHSGKAMARIGGRTREYVKTSKDRLVEKIIFKTRCARRVPLPDGKMEAVGKRGQIELTYTQPEKKAAPESKKRKFRRHPRMLLHERQLFANNH